MLRRTMTVAALFALVLAAGSVSAQSNCVLGVYGDAGGNVVDLTPERDPFTPTQFDVYYVIFAEDFLNAVAFDREFIGFDNPFTGVPNNIFSLGFAYGPTLDAGDCAECVDEFGNPWATALFQTVEGFRLGLGACKVGVGGLPVTLMKETILLGAGADGGVIQVLPNVLENPDFPTYNSCINEIIPCNAGALTVQRPISNDSDSWGSVKALYSN